MTKTFTPFGDACYDVPKKLFDDYYGTGYALAAIKDNELTAICYLRDIDDEFDFLDDELEFGETAQDRLLKIMADERVGAVAKQMNALGNVHIGLLSCYQFIEM